MYNFFVILGLCNFGLEWCNPTEAFPTPRFSFSAVSSLPPVLYFFFVLLFEEQMKNTEEKDEGRGKRNERGEKEGEEWKSSLLFFFARKFV